MLSYLWKATRGYRLRPWRSPYLLWRIETYWGVQLERAGLLDFLHFVWARRREMFRFLRWTGRMSHL